jgi:hypothetical protein
MNLLIAAYVIANWALCSAFVPSLRSNSALTRHMCKADGGETQTEKIFAIDFPLGDGYEDFELEIKPLFENSFVYIIEYPVPFKLNVEPDARVKTVPIVTKAGAGGEEVGDVLRACTAWSQGMQAAGLTSDIMQFAGNVKWRKSVFQTAGSPWAETVAALQSNTAERSSTVALLFEREIDDVAQAELMAAQEAEARVE